MISPDITEMLEQLKALAGDPPVYSPNSPDHRDIQIDNWIRWSARIGLIHELEHLMRQT